MMVLGILNTVLSHLRQYLKYWWNEANFLCTMLASDRLCCHHQQFAFHTTSTFPCYLHNLQHCLTAKTWKCNGNIASSDHVQWLTQLSYRVTQRLQITLVPDLTLLTQVSSGITSFQFSMNPAQTKLTIFDHGQPRTTMVDHKLPW